MARTTTRQPAPILAVTILPLLALTCGCSKRDDTKKDKEPAPVPVRVAKAEKRSLRPSFEVIGTVLAEPERYATLTAPTPGLVERLAVSEGKQVASKELIVQLDEREAQTALDRAEAAFARLVARPRPEELTQARGVVAKMKAAHSLAEARLQKSLDLQKRSPELVPEVQIFEERRNEETARAEWDSAQAQMQLLEKGPREEQRKESQVEVDAAKLHLAFCRVTAPFAGQVVELKARVGQKADVGTPLATILDSSEVLVQARVPGEHLARVLAAIQAGGMEFPAAVRCEAFPGVEFAVRSGWLNQQTEAQTSDVPIKLRVPNDKKLLRVGMTVEVELRELPIEGVAIPENAVAVNEDGHRVVTVIKDGKAVPTEIKLTDDKNPEVRADGWVRVIEGLEEGDEVAVENGYGLPKDTPVVVEEPKAPEKHEKD